ncbi:hypothetical protein D7X33_03560 [Butyricicoccus sp. 1XD8-22]|nr:hypothetical protein D7X33_03560 [Butyricicoccus sp. 1XD8-22]
MEKKRQISEFFRKKDFKSIYQAAPETVNEMLLIDSPTEFDDFLEQEGCIAEPVFWLFYGALHGDSLMIGGYEGNVGEKAAVFLKKHLTDTEFHAIHDEIRQLHVDIDDDLGCYHNLAEKIAGCNALLENTGRLLHLEFDDTYCAGVYFLSIV